MRMVPQIGERINYARGFLLELRMCPLSMVRPLCCGDTEVILDEPIVKLAGQETAAYSDDYFSHGVTTRHIITGITLQGDVTLHTSEKPWKPAHKDDNKSEKNKNLEAAVIFIMNRLTPSNFEKLAEEMKALEIKTYDDLELVVNVVFDKVSLETKFVQAYAALCKVMLGLQVDPPASVARNRATFRAILVSKCQQTFEANKIVLFEDPEQTKSRIKMEMPEDTTARAEHIELTLYHMKLKRLKFFGNISFIGELFKLGIISEVIIHSCITRLLSTPDEESLLSLCKLLTTVGRHIDTKKSKQQIDKYFQRIMQLADASKSRLKFSLKDIIDLRKNKWTSRNEQAGPKTIAQLHKDFKEEQAQVQTVSGNQQNFSTIKQAPQQRQQGKPVRGYLHNRPSKESSAKSQESGDLLVNTESDKENDPTWSQVNSKAKAKGKKKSSNKIIIDGSKSDKQALAKVASRFPLPEADGYKEVSEHCHPQPNPNKKLAAEEDYLCRNVDDENFEDKSSSADIDSLKKINVSRLKLSRTTIDEDIKLVPGGGRMGMSFSIFRSQTIQEDSKTSTSLETNVRIDSKNNRFSLLDASEGDKVSGNLNGHHHSDEINCLQTTQPTKRKRHRGKGSSQKIQTDLKSPDLPLEESQTLGDIAFDKVIFETSEVAPGLEKIKGKQLTPDELELRCKDIIDEYLNCRDEKEVQQGVKELVGLADMATFVTLVVNHVLEKTNDVRQLIGQIFDGLVMKQIISLDEFIQGFSEIMAIAQDVVIDIPMLWTYLAQLMAPMLGQSFPWAKLDSVLIPYIEPKSCSVICANIFSILLKLTKMAPEDMTKAWTQTGLEWTQFMDADRVASFLSDHKLGNIFLTNQDKFFSCPSTADNTMEINTLQPYLNTYPNEINEHKNDNLCEVKAVASEIKHINAIENNMTVQTESTIADEAESCNNGTDSPPPVHETPLAMSVIHLTNAFENNAIVPTDPSQTSTTDPSQTIKNDFKKEDDAVCIKDAIVSSLPIYKTSFDLSANKTANKRADMIENCETPGVKFSRNDEAVSCGVTASNPLICETSTKMSGYSNVYDHSDEEGEASWRKEMEEDELYFNSCFVQCQSESSEKKFIICCVPSFGDTESEVEFHCDRFDYQSEAHFEDSTPDQLYSEDTDASYSQTHVIFKNAEVHLTPTHDADGVSSYTPWSDNAQEDFLAYNLSVDAPVFIPSNLKSSVINAEEWDSNDLIKNNEHIFKNTSVNCEKNNNLPAALITLKNETLSLVENSYTARKYFTPDFNQDLSASQEEFMYKVSHHEHDAEIPVTLCHNHSQNPASHYDDKEGELGWSFRTGYYYNSPLPDFSSHSSLLESCQAHETTFPVVTAYSANAEVDQDCFTAARLTHSHSIDPMIVQTCDASLSPSSRSLDSASLCCHQDPEAINTVSVEMDAPLYHNQNRANSPSIVHRCRLAMVDLANLLRQNCSNKDLIMYIEIQIFNTDLEKFALSMFMTVIGYTALTAMNAQIIKERRDVLAFLIKYNPELELEAIKALHVVMKFVPKPLGIIDLYNALYTEGLVSHQVLLHWSFSLTATKDKQNFVARTIFCAFDYVIATLKANSEY